MHFSIYKAHENVFHDDIYALVVEILLCLSGYVTGEKIFINLIVEYLLFYSWYKRYHQLDDLSVYYLFMQQFFCKVENRCIKESRGLFKNLTRSTDRGLRTFFGRINLSVRVTPYKLSFA